MSDLNISFNTINKSLFIWINVNSYKISELSFCFIKDSYKYIFSLSIQAHLSP